MDYAYQMGEIIAPCDLEGGYFLDIEFNGEIRTIVVPEGGAKMGATFCGRILPQQGQPPEGPSPNPFPKGPTATSIATTTQDPLDSEIPMGAWRDGICDCCVKFPVCCMAYCCEMILLGQVLTRLHLGWCSQPSRPPSQNNTCRILLGFTLVYNLSLIIAYIFFYAEALTCYDALVHDSSYYRDRHLSSYGSYPTYTTYTTYHYEYYTYYDLFTECAGPGGTAAFWILWTIAFGIFIYTSVLMCQTRQKMRKKYNIAGDECNDCCCSFFAGVAL